MKKTPAVDENLVDMDELLKFLLNEYNIVIKDKKYREQKKEDLINWFEFYKNNISDVPNVKIGQTVWVVKGDYSCEKERRVFDVIECVVSKKTIKKRYNFTVTGEHYYIGTFTKSSIGKTVFFTEEEAKKKAKLMNK